ncbi:MAG: NAD-dependent malic enzyme [Candidatus Omnitrophica bacterium CG11_big_fil_rev_8_21_14_0_20_63_9]|nr:MAG: NAD-dependent malic enzyme [Candidatus Omnitrophica bacterium CG11_big_fil_rev_8_21_14_0_20_63_9]
MAATMTTQVVNAGSRLTEAARRRIFRAHRGGVIEVRSRFRLKTSRDLQRLYTPGVAEVCRQLQAHPEEASQYTWRDNTMAIVTNGSAVMSLGAIGTQASLPVMEAKAALFRELVGLNGVPILIESREPETVIKVVEQIAASFGAVMLEDIESPACFEIERTLTERLAIPVLHADQHATAVAVLAALKKAAVFVQKPYRQLNVLIHGSGPSGLAVARLLHVDGVRDILMCQTDGTRWPGSNSLHDATEKLIAELVNRDGGSGQWEELLKGRDVLISTSSQGRITAAHIRTMAERPIALVISNPRPALTIDELDAAGCVVALDGTAVNNLLAFPGLFRGALNAKARRFSDRMLVAAADALADSAPQGRLVADPLDRQAHSFVAHAVSEAAMKADHVALRNTPTSAITSHGT